MVLVCETVSMVWRQSRHWSQVSGVQHRPVKLVIHVQRLTSCCYKWVRGKHLPDVSNWDQSSMDHLRELVETDIDAARELWHLPAGVLPSLHVSCDSAHGLQVGDRVPKVSMWPVCGVDTGRLEHARQGRTTGDLMLSWRRFLAFSRKTPRHLSPSGKMTRKTVV